MKKIFLLGAIFTPLLFFALPVYACETPVLKPGDPLPPPPPPRVLGWHEINIDENTEGYTLVRVAPGDTCGPRKHYIKNEVLYGAAVGTVGVGVAGILVCALWLFLMRKRRAKK